MVHLLSCGDPDELEELSFTVSSSHFGALQTIELEDGGTMKRVTMDNKDNFVHKMYQWYLTGNVPTHHAMYNTHTHTHTFILTGHILLIQKINVGCIKTQLQSIKEGFLQLIQPHTIADFSAEELQVAVSGKRRISVAFLRQRMTYRNHVKEETKKWLWEILQSFTQVRLIPRVHYVMVILAIFIPCSKSCPIFYYFVPAVLAYQLMSHGSSQLLQPPTTVINAN